VIEEPPEEDGEDHETATSPFPGVPETAVGEEGGEFVVIGVDGELYGPVPTQLTAATLKT